MNISNKILRCQKLSLGVLCLLLAHVANADVWPSRVIKFVVPFGPGGANDLVARGLLRKALLNSWGKP